MPGAELHDLRAATEAALPEYLRDLQRLVDVDCGSYTKAGVDEVGAWVALRLRELGASVVQHADAELGDTVVGTFERRSGRADGPAHRAHGHRLRTGHGRRAALQRCGTVAPTVPASAT